MKTHAQLREIITSYPFYKVNAHIHTHLCDGAANMTVENITTEAEKAGFELVILTPHFHKKLTDRSATLYWDSDESIFLQLRDEIDYYERTNGRIKVLLSTEADILTVNGDLSLSPSAAAEQALDMITPTVNFHPLLPLAAIEATFITKVDEFYSSGKYASLIPDHINTTDIIQTYYEATVNAVRNCRYPGTLGHFFIAHTIPDRKHAWFDFHESHLPMMLEGARRVVEACENTERILDITGIHLLNGTTPSQQPAKDGFLYRFQCATLDMCRQKNVPFVPGSDAHNLPRIHECKLYKEIFSDYI